MTFPRYSKFATTVIPGQPEDSYPWKFPELSSNVFMILLFNVLNQFVFE